ncbi:hypothetical protein F1559_004871 [Cyanidiococcus yangmingshanensis]|uniref:5'-3' exonuclease domain-containing protein n=1 Tax=Cyanidiococcus yangmingshanensis TaxID=2690220 RepID=A0A7J7IQK2_9RHOD|nr:hypothetical protein F1559_004871 [Cyanidiococcus yangmingshanensis]
MSLGAPDSSSLFSETETESDELGIVTGAGGRRDWPPGEVLAGTDPQHTEEADSPPVLFLLDALSIVYRSYYALQNRPLFSSNGINTSAIYGFTQTVMLLLQRYNPDAMAVVFDSHTTEPGPGSFRQKLFPNYKANRERMPDGVRDALPYVKRILHLLGIQSFELDSYEADDVIGTLATEANHAGYQVVIVSSDKDFRQLLKPDWLRILRPARSGASTGFEEVTESRLAAECGVPIRSTQYADVLALAGDSVDNIPGVPGIGPKTAARLIYQLHSIENLLSNLDAVQPVRLREKIIVKADEILRNKILVKIQTNVPLNALRPDLSDSDEIDSTWPDDRCEPDIGWLSCCRRRPWNVHDLVALLRELDMDALTRRVQYLARFHGQGRLEQRTNDRYRTVPRTNLTFVTPSTTSWNDTRATSGGVAGAEPAETGTSDLSAGCHSVNSEGRASTMRPAIGPASAAAATALVGRSVTSVESQSMNTHAAKHCGPAQAAASSIQSDLTTNELAALVGCTTPV